MSYPSGVYDIKFNETAGQHGTDVDTRKGSVTVRYGNGTRRTFTGIARRMFFQWYMRGWKRPPKGIVLKEQE